MSALRQRHASHKRWFATADRGKCSSVGAKPVAFIFLTLSNVIQTPSVIDAKPVSLRQSFL
jgi:hypothetical protein